MKDCFVAIITNDVEWYKFMESTIGAWIRGQCTLFIYMIDNIKNFNRRWDPLLVLLDLSVFFGLGSISQPGDKIHELLSMQPKAWIVSVSNNPSWREARECYRAGSKHYMPKNFKTANRSKNEMAKLKEKIEYWILRGGYTWKGIEY